MQHFKWSHLIQISKDVNARFSSNIQIYQYSFNISTSRISSSFECSNFIKHVKWLHCILLLNSRVSSNILMVEFNQTFGWTSFVTFFNNRVLRKTCQIFKFLPIFYMAELRSSFEMLNFIQLLNDRISLNFRMLSNFQMVEFHLISELSNSIKRIKWSNFNKPVLMINLRIFLRVKQNSIIRTLDQT